LSAPHLATARERWVRSGCQGCPEAIADLRALEGTQGVAIHRQVPEYRTTACALAGTHAAAGEFTNKL